MILAGIATIREIGERFGVDDMIVSAQGIRDGIAYEAAGIPPPTSVDELINRSAAVSARSFRFPVEHGVEVERLATELFDAVRRRFDWGPENGTRSGPRPCTMISAPRSPPGTTPSIRRTSSATPRCWG